MLIGWYGNRVSASDAVITHALQHTPSLILDCANRADPYSFMHEAPIEAFDHVHVVSFDLLYSLQDALLRAPQDLQETKAQTLIVTAFDGLFNYQDDEENENLYQHAWQLLRRIAKRYDVHVAFTHKQRPRAMKYCEVIKWDIPYQVSA